jgi:hypothetical protein
MKTGRKCRYNVSLWRVRVNTISMVNRQCVPFTNLSHIHCCCEKNKISHTWYCTFQIAAPLKKFTLEQVVKVKRGSRSISTLSLTSALNEGGWSTPPPGRFTPGKETRYQSCRRLGGSQDRSETVWKISAVS